MVGAKSPVGVLHRNTIHGYYNHVNYRLAGHEATRRLRMPLPCDSPQCLAPPGISAWSAPVRMPGRASFQAGWHISPWRAGEFIARAPRSMRETVLIYRP